MENISENKRKRGRPEKVSLNGVVINEFVRSSDQIGLIDPEIKSKRGKINSYYMIHAFGALRNENGKHPIDGEFSFIIAADERNIYAFKKTILQELGRFEFDNIIKLAAGRICKDKMTTSQAISYIRKIRTGKNQMVVV
jgi:hypothetical protein